MGLAWLWMHAYITKLPEADGFGLLVCPYTFIQSLHWVESVDEMAAQTSNLLPSSCPACIVA